MARPLRIEYPGAFYNVTSRGNEQKDVFKSQKDREKFLSYVESAVVRYGAVVHTWCLMSNYYHLLLETPSGNLSQIMRHIDGAYTTYVNVKRQRAGHLFQGRYQATLVEADAYALALSRSMHLNPVRAGMVAKPEHYQWSSYRSSIGQCTTPGWLKTGCILGYCGRKAPDAKNTYRRFVEDLLDSEYESPLKAAVASTVLGRSAFVRELSERLKIKAELGGRAALWSNVSLYGCQKYSGAKLKDRGERFGIRDAAVSQASRRLAFKAKTDQQLQERLDRVETLLRNVKS